MHSIKIGKNLFSLPSGWEELTEYQVKRVALLGGKGIERELTALYLLSSQNLRKFLQKIDPAKIVEIARLLTFLRERQKVQEAEDEIEPLVKSFRHKGTRYYFPEKSLNDVTVGEWMWAEVIIKKIQEEPHKAEEHLPTLLAVLCRPHRPKRERQANDFDGYPRIAFNPERIPVLEKKMKGVSPWVFYILQDYVSRCQEMLNLRYGVIFQGQKSEGLNLGWKGVVISVAEANIFGTERHVMKENIHNVCLYLAKKIIEKKEMDKKLEEIRRNNRYARPR